MGRRSGVPHTESGMNALSDADLDAEIERVRRRLPLAPSALLTKAFHRKLHLLTKIRDRRQSV